MNLTQFLAPNTQRILAKVGKLVDSHAIDGPLCIRGCPTKTTVRMFNCTYKLHGGKRGYVCNALPAFICGSCGHILIATKYGFTKAAETHGLNDSAINEILFPLGEDHSLSHQIKVELKGALRSPIQSLGGADASGLVDSARDE
jgi:hypothetical protein